MDFGVRRPLRFLAHKLSLDDAQVEKLAVVISELKTERAQADVDNQRAVALFADAVAGEKYERAKAEEGMQKRALADEREAAAVQKGLAALHALMTADQRVQFAQLLRAGLIRV